MTKKSREMGLIKAPSLAPGAIEKLMDYSWPGNVRELQNAVDRALILSGGKPLIFEDLGEPGNRISPVSTLPSNAEPQGLDQAVVKHIKQALEMTNGRVGGEQGAAKLLRMNPSTLRTKMRKLGIPFGREKVKP